MTEVAKIEVEHELPEGYVIVDRVVLLKCLNVEGKLVWREDFGGSNAMELIGMLTTAADTARQRMVHP